MMLDAGIYVGMRAVGYLRRSTDMQDQSLESQRAAIEKFAGEQGLAIFDWYVDDAISGTSTNGRSDFLRMIECACRTPRMIDAIVVYDVKRFGRMDNDETGYYRHILRMHDVEVLYVSEGFTGRFEDDLIRPVKQWQARQESRDLAKIVIRGYLTKIRSSKGWWMAGVPPYGYDRRYEDGGGRFLYVVRNMPDMTKQVLDRYGRLMRTLESNERLILSERDRCRLVPGQSERVALVRRIFHDFVECDIGCTMIAHRLNQEGISPPMRMSHDGIPTSGEWRYATIHNILRNPAYVGDVVWNRRTAGKFYRIHGDGEIERLERDAGKVRFNDRNDWIRIADAHAPLICRRIQRQAFALLSERNERSGRTSLNYHRAESDFRSQFVLTGLMECARCGGSFRGMSTARFYSGRSAKPYRARIYGCMHRKAVRGKKCHNGYVRRRVLERLIADRVTAWYRRLVERQGRSCFHDEAAAYCEHLARCAGERDRPRKSNADIRVFLRSAREFVDRLPHLFFASDLQTRRLAYRRCIDRIRVDITARRITIWVQQLPILGAKSIGLTRIYARLPASREAFTMCRKKRRKCDQRTFDFAWHAARKSKAIRELALAARAKLKEISPDVCEGFHQQYISYSLGKHFACLKVRKTRLLLFLKLDPSSISTLPANMRDVTGLGTQATGNLEVSIESHGQLAAVLPYVKAAYRRVRAATPL